MKVLECSQQYTFIFQTLKGSLLSIKWSDLAEIQTRSSFYSCPCYLQE